MDFSIARDAAKAFLPGTNLVTALSRDNVNRRAQFIEQTISKLFSDSVTEVAKLSHNASEWKPGKGIVVSLKLDSTTSANGTPDQLASAGKWTVTLSNPRPSIFSDIEICKADTLPRCRPTPELAISAAYASISPAQVLNYVLDNNVTIAKHIQSQAWHKDAVIGLASGYASDKFQTYCSNVVNEMYSQLLNHTDAVAVVWSLVRAGYVPNVVWAQHNPACNVAANALSATGLATR